MKNAFRLTLAVLITTVFACDPATKHPKADDKTVVGVDSISVMADDSTATIIQSDSIPVSK